MTNTTNTSTDLTVEEQFATLLLVMDHLAERWADREFDDPDVMDDPEDHYLYEVITTFRDALNDEALDVLDAAQEHADEFIAYVDGLLEDEDDEVEDEGVSENIGGLDLSDLFEAIAPLLEALIASQQDEDTEDTVGQVGYNESFFRGATEGRPVQSDAGFGAFVVVR